MSCFHYNNCFYYFIPFSSVLILWTVEKIAHLTFDMDDIEYDISYYPIIKYLMVYLYLYDIKGK